MTRQPKIPNGVRRQKRKNKMAKLNRRLYTYTYARCLLLAVCELPFFVDFSFTTANIFPLEPFQPLSTNVPSRTYVHKAEIDMYIHAPCTHPLCYCCSRVSCGVAVVRGLVAFVNRSFECDHVPSCLAFPALAASSTKC